MSRDDLENLVMSDCGAVWWTRGSDWTASDVIEAAEIELSDDEALIGKPVFLHDYDGDYYEECRENDPGAFAAIRWEVDAR